MEVKGSGIMKNKINIREMVDEARSSCCGESYTVLEQNNVYRIGAGVIMDNAGKCSFFMDINADLCSGNPLFRIQYLEKTVQFVKELRDRGFELVCGEGQITAEKFMDKSELKDEFERIKQIISDLKIMNDAGV